MSPIPADRDIRHDLPAVAGLILRNLHLFRDGLLSWGVQLYGPGGSLSAWEILAHIGMRAPEDGTALSDAERAYAEFLWDEAASLIRHLSKSCDSGSGSVTQ